MAHTEDPVLLADPYGKSFVHFSEADPEERTTAIVFVHGLFGNPVTTWWEFQNLIDRDASQGFWSRSDVYFYQYESFGHSVSELSQRLREFLTLVFPAPSRNIFELEVLPEIREILAPGSLVLEPRLPATYSSLYLVGHSLGGVAIRQALVDFATIWKAQGPERQQVEAFLKAEVRLFSPAIRGFQPTGIRGFLYHYAANNPIIAAFYDSLKTLQELRADSVRLSELQRDTERFANEYNWMTAMVANIIYAENDIVYPGRYECDRVERTQTNHDHESACKPHPRYPEPLWFVEHGVDYERISSARPR